VAKRSSAAELLAVPAYTIAEAAWYLDLPQSTVSSWVKGRLYPPQVGRRKKKFEPVIIPADAQHFMLSFENLIELYVLGALRREYRVTLQRVRRAVAKLRIETHDAHPLASQDLFTDRRSVFVERMGAMVNISEDDQTSMKDVLGRYLERVERTPAHIPIRLFPLTRANVEQSPKHIAIDPRFRFGRPFIVDCGVETSVIAERFIAGDTVEHLTKEYDCGVEAIEEALRYEQRRAS
jgi:uncharacterized protein (DUF433 family)